MCWCFINFFLKDILVMFPSSCAHTYEFYYVTACCGFFWLNAQNILGLLVMYRINAPYSC